MNDISGLLKKEDTRAIIAAVKDELAGSFLQPAFFKNEDVAIRAFRNNINSIQIWKSNPSDFSLYHLGSFDETTGIIMGCTPTKIIGGTGLVDRNNDL